LDKRIGEPGFWPERYKKGNLPPEEIFQNFPSPESIAILVVGGGAKPMYQTGGMKYLCSKSIDKWK
jgi:hypothetical protein